MTDNAMNRENIAVTLEILAQEIPEAKAVILARTDFSVTFQQLNEEVNRLATGLLPTGITRGHRVLVMVPAGLEFLALTFALFKIGAVPVLIDPGLGRKSVLAGIRKVAPDAMIAVPLAHAARLIFSRAFKKTKIHITVGRRWFWGGPTLAKVRASGRPDFQSTETRPEDPAAILFTSGSTGPPKGVLYTHRMFARQVSLLQKIYGIKKGEVDLPTFPLFALFGVSLGMTCVLPDMDARRPADVDPEKIIRAIRKYSVTSSFGSPALWHTVSKYCLEKNIQIPELKRILMAGAPVPGPLLQRFDRILSPEAEIHTPYGATEALPVASLSRKEILGETWRRTVQGLGICVGQPVPELSLRIIQITDAPIAKWTEELTVAPGVIGEIVVQAAWVAEHYFNSEAETRLAKIPQGETFWHRMGDVGYLDEQERLWFCGRKNHRVTLQDKTLYTIPCEAIFNTHPEVQRSALVGTGPRGSQQPVMVIELADKTKSQEQRNTLRRELLELGSRQAITRDITRILFHPAFPVDIRHNAKISREQLARWATSLRLDANG